MIDSCDCSQSALVHESHELHDQRGFSGEAMLLRWSSLPTITIAVTASLLDFGGLLSQPDVDSAQAFSSQCAGVSPGMLLIQCTCSTRRIAIWGKSGTFQRAYKQTRAPNCVYTLEHSCSTTRYAIAKMAHSCQWQRPIPTQRRFVAGFTSVCIPQASTIPSILGVEREGFVTQTAT